MSDELIEQIACGIEAGSFSDIMGTVAKKKRAREDAGLRFQTRKAQQGEIAQYVRSFKAGHGNDPLAVLEEIADGQRAELLLHDAWPLAWRGLCDISVTILTTTNSLPPPTSYHIKLTERGEAMLKACRTNPDTEEGGKHG